MAAKFLCIMMLATAICSAGCSSFKQDINKALLITAVLVDIDDKGDPNIYFEGLRPLRTAAKDKKEDRTIFIIHGKTVSEIINSLSAASSNIPNFSHNKIVIFTKRAAQAGLERYTDLFARDQHHLVRSYVAIYDGKPDDLFDAKLPGDTFLGLYCFDMFRNYTLKSAKLIDVRVQNLFNGRYEFGEISVLPILKLTQHKEKLISLSGAAVLHDFKLAAVLSEQEVADYNIFQNTSPLTMYTIENPMYPGNYISLRSVKTNHKTRVSYDGNVIVLSKNVDLDLAFEEAQYAISLSPEQREQLKTSLTQQLKTEWDGFFDKYKAQSVDVVNLEEMFRRRYPHEQVDNPLSKAVLDLNIVVNIEGSGHYQSFN